MKNGWCPRHGDRWIKPMGLGENRRIRCSKCATEAVSNRRRKVKSTLVKERGGKCERCGYNKCIWALDFHHIDPSTKLFSMSSGGFTIAIDRFREEAKKCELVCANCHREIEHKVRGNSVVEFLIVNQAVVGSNPTP